MALSPATMSGSLRSGVKVIFAARIVSLGLLTQAQTFTGAVTGRVLDPHQAVTPNAVVILRDVERGVERDTTTNDVGEYAFRLVRPGRFTIRAEVNGFSPTTVPVEVVVATPTRADINLSVEKLQQTIQVIGENGVAVQTETAGLGQTINPRQISELPSLTRNPYDFLAIMAGANLSNDGRGVGLAPYGSGPAGGKSGGLALNGQRTVSGNFLLDGGENNDTFVSAPAQSVPLDSIAEVNVQTNHYTAEYGRNAGFTANVITKSGTQQFHGSVYDYIRNSALAANTFNNNANGLPRPVFNRHQFGGTLGGPIRKENFFFFVSVEPILVRSSAPNQFFVPTPQLLAISSPSTQAIFQRYPLPENLSSTDFRSNKVCPYGVTCDLQTHTGFVTIPTFASTFRTGPQDAGAGPPQNTVLATGRVDWMIDAKSQFFVRYAFQDYYQFPIASQPYSSQLDQSTLGRNQNIDLNLIRSWSTNFTTESRILYNRVLGNSPRVPQPSIPAFGINNETAALPSGSSVFGGPQNLYQFFQTATWVHGHHTLKFGAQYVQLRDNRTWGILDIAGAQFLDVQGFVNGNLAFYSLAIDPKGHYPGQTINPPFGLPSFTRHYRYNELSLFIADTWRITSTLTITPGLRWEYFGVFHSPGAEHPLDSNFYPGAGSSYLQQIANGRFLRTLDAPGDLQGHFYLPDFKNFAPRLGFAYDLTGDGKAAFRGGVGVFYDRVVGFQLFRAFQNPPNYSVTTLTDVRLKPELLSNQYAAFANKPLLLNQSDTRAPAQNFRPAYAVEWNATLERELAADLVVSISYVGASGARLYSVDNINRIGSGGLLNPSCIATRFASDGITHLGPLYTNCPRLNPNVSSIVIRGNEGHSTFHALQLKLDSRYLSNWGLQFGINYTLSHSIDNASTSIGGDSVTNPNQAPRFLDAFQPSLDRGSSDFDQRHRIAANFIWDIPLGRNSKNWRGRYFLGGWEISGLWSYQTGQPFSIFDSGAPDFNDEIGRPRLIGKQPKRVGLIPSVGSPNTFLYVPINQVYDPATNVCIANTAPFACVISVNGPFNGVISRNTYRRPGTYYQDTSLLKNIPLPREEMKLQFRVEFYNLLNHPNLYVNGGTSDVHTSNFNPSAGLTVPGVTAFFQDSRQIVLALKFIF